MYYIERTYLFIFFYKNEINIIIRYKIREEEHGYQNFW